MRAQSQDFGDVSEDSGMVARTIKDYRAVCIECGSSSGQFPTQADALQWRERHCHDDPSHAEIVIESRIILPSGTLGRFFQTT